MSAAAADTSAGTSAGGRRGGRSLPWWLSPLGWRLLLVLAAGATLLVTLLPDPVRPVVAAAVAAQVVVVLAAATAWRVAGTAALTLVTLAVLLASALDESDLRPVQVLTAAVLLLVVISALDRTEQTTQTGQRGRSRWTGWLGTARRRDVVLRAPATRRFGPAVSALGAASLVSVATAQHVVPSVALVVLGVAAALAALVVATRVHRN